MEMILIAVIALFVLEYDDKISTNKFIKDNSSRFRILKENDYDFLVKARYGDTADPDILFSTRVKSAGIIFAVMILLFLGNLSFINFVLS
jgi:hypothetical protein